MALNFSAHGSAHSSALWRDRPLSRYAGMPDIGQGLILEQAGFAAAQLRQDGTILALSRSTRHMLGYPPGMAVGKNIFPYLHPDDLSAARHALQCVTGGNAAIERLTCRVLNLSGEWRVMETTLGTTDEQTGKSVIVNFLDITEHQRAFLRAGKRDRELEHMLRLHSLGELAAALSHELMQPFAAVTGYIGGSIARLRQPQQDLAAIVTALEAANAEAQRAGQIMARMRQFMSRHEPATTRIDAREVVRAIHDFIRLKAERAGCRLDVREPGEGDFAIHGDPVLLGQVVLNMAFNGIEAMNETPPHERRLAISTDRLPNAVRFTVEDRGCGLPPVNPDRLFESFFTTKREGSGIGLSLCRTIVEAYGGHIWVARLPQGSRFHVSIPLAEGAMTE